MDAYYKNLYALVVDDPSNADIYDNRGIGDVKGVDFSVRKDLGDGFFAWLTYSHSDSEELTLPGQAWGLYPYDQPDILNLVSSYSPSRRWTFGAKFRFNSGNLVEAQDSDTYTQRLAPYARLDVRAQRTWLFQDWTLDAYLEVINLLDRKNPADEFVDPSTGRTTVVDDLPFLPNLGVEAKY